MSFGVFLESLIFATVEEIKKSLERSFQGLIRKEWDLNPRYPFSGYASLAGTCLRPLSHLSRGNAKVGMSLAFWGFSQQASNVETLLFGKDF